MIDRFISDKIHASRKSVLLLGPRQVGKSTLLLSLKPDLTINLARESEYHLYTSQPDRLERIVEAQHYKTIFIDEVQRLPALLNTVQALIDESRGGLKFYLSGSSARKLRRGQANLLPGRILTYRMGGLCAGEIPPEIKTENLLKYGCLPEIALSKDIEGRQALLDAYAGTYLREEIQAEALVQNLPGFSRFITEAALTSGQILDFSKISKRAKISRTSCVRFFEILEDTLMAERCDVFTDVKNLEPIKHPKYFFFDNGVRNALLESYDLSPERKGFVFEHFLFNQIKNSAMALAKQVQIKYFRTRSGLEVDFVVQIDKDLWAIEAKAGEISESDTKSLRTFKSAAKQPVQCLAVGLKETVARKSGPVLICNWRTMLNEMGLGKQKSART